MRILYIEDEVDARRVVARDLSEHQFDVDTAVDAGSGLAMLGERSYDALILDIGLPDRDGFDLLDSLRRDGLDIPVIVLTAHASVADRVRGLDLGADDFLAKPFALAELRARIRALSRRSSGPSAADRMVVADLQLDPARHRVERDGQLIHLTPKEFRLLEFLMRNQTFLVSRAMITEHVWGAAFDNFSNAIDVHINNLRRKVDRGFDHKLIHTIKGVGYIMEIREREKPDAKI